MQRICRSTLRLRRRPTVFPATLGPPRRRSSALAGRCPPSLKPAALALPVPDQLSRLDEPWHMRQNVLVRSEKKQVELDWKTKKMNVIEAGKETQDTFQNVHDENFTDDDIIYTAPIISDSSHRDGATYRKNWWSIVSMDMADRTETVPDLKELLSDSNCAPDPENCRCYLHGPREIMQVFWMRLFKTPINSSSIQLYGYMAARDYIDGRLNYVFNRRRDDPIVVQEAVKGSLIEMTGPKRGIVMLSEVLFEFDMRIKTGENEENDVQLIDGVTSFEDRMSYDFPFIARINGNCGVVDMCSALLEYGVEATIEITISEVVEAFSLSVSSFLYIGEVCKEVQIFHGTASEMDIRSVVAVPMDTKMHLKFSVGQKGSDSDVLRYFSIDAKLHGCTRRQLKLETACISVKVAWQPPFY